MTAGAVKRGGLSGITRKREPCQPRRPLTNRYAGSSAAKANAVIGDKRPRTYASMSAGSLAGRSTHASSLTSSGAQGAQCRRAKRGGRVGRSEFPGVIDGVGPDEVATSPRRRMQHLHGGPCDSTRTSNPMRAICNAHEHGTTEDILAQTDRRPIISTDEVRRQIDTDLGHRVTPARIGKARRRIFHRPLRSDSSSQERTSPHFSDYGYR